MKKLLLMSLSFLVLGFTAGCNGSGGNDEGYTDNDDRFVRMEFVRQLEEDEKKTLADTVTKNLSKLSGLEYEKEETTNNDYTVESKVTKRSGKFASDSKLTNNYILNYHEDYDESKDSQGIKLAKSYTSEVSVWDTTTSSTAEDKFVATKTVKTIGEKTTTTVDSENLTQSSKDYKKNTLEGYAFTMKDLDAYEDKDGNFIFASSSRTKSVTIVEMGADERDEVTWNYDQKIFTIKDQKLVSYTSFVATKSNRDATTKDWYRDVKTTSSTYESYEYAYDAIASDSVDNLNKSIKDHVSFDAITCNVFTGEASGTSRSESDITVNHTGSSTTQSVEYIDKDSTTSRTIAVIVSLNHYGGTSGAYTFDNAALEFDVITRTGVEKAVTSHHYVNFTNKLPSEAEDLIIKEKESGDNKYYYLVNTSSKDIELKVTLKITASNYSILECTYTAKEA